MIQIFAKHSNKRVGSFFASNEFDCECVFNDCLVTMIDADLVKRLDTLRESINQPLAVESGFRCARHQQALRESGLQTAKGKSTHEVGMGSDVHSAGFEGTYLGQLAKEIGFTSVGIAGKWIHVDTRADKKRNWFY